MNLVAAAPAATAARGPRDIGIDWVRGLVMAIMVLDHARDFVHGFRDDPTDMTTTTPLLFATRWITHFCAPVFVFFAGTSAFLYARKHTTRERTVFLLTRGLWLVVLEVTVIRLGWAPDLGYHFTLLQVIWAIGWSMVALAALAYLPRPLLVAIALAVVVGHNFTDSIHADDLGPVRVVWIILHERHRVVLAPGHFLYVAYPLIPWIFVMALGYAFGPIATRAPADRATWCLRAGLLCSAAFVALRAINYYGDPEPWSLQRSWPITVASFLNCEKYPPSLDYLLMTLGPALVVLSRAPTEATSFITRALTVFGRVPLFFYVAHLFLLRFAVVAVAALTIGNTAFRPPPQGTGGSPQLPLGWVYVAWIAALLLLYPACRWFAGVKGRSNRWWLSYV